VGNAHLRHRGGGRHVPGTLNREHRRD
jgi:hypothetical protein